MQINYKEKTIYCFYCKKELSLDKVFLNVLFETSITCPCDHILGYTYDKEWIWLMSPCLYLILEDRKLKCKCVDEEINCEGIDEQCCFPLAKRCYEEDLNE